jgi:hypothetical protein
MRSLHEAFDVGVDQRRQCFEERAALAARGEVQRGAEIRRHERARQQLAVARARRAAELAGGDGGARVGDHVDEDLVEQRAGVAGDVRVLQRRRQDGAADLAREAGLLAEHHHGRAQCRQWAAGQRGGARFFGLARLDAHQIGDDRVLGRVVDEEGPLGHAGALGDRVDGGRVVAARGEELRGGGEQARLGVVGAQLARGSLGCHSRVTIGQ